MVETHVQTRIYHLEGRSSASLSDWKELDLLSKLGVLSSPRFFEKILHFVKFSDYKKTQKAGRMGKELSKNMTEKEFDNSYWYAKELKEFAKKIGVSNSSKLRKDELEPLIKHFLGTGQIKKVKRIGDILIHGSIRF